MTSARLKFDFFSPLKFAIHSDLSLDMVNCVGCKKKFKNDKSYSNHWQHCDNHKLELAQCLRLRQDNMAKKAKALEESTNSNPFNDGQIPALQSGADFETNETEGV